MRWRKFAIDPDTGQTVEELQWVLASCVPVIDPDGKLVSISGTTVDINPQKRSQIEAMERAEALERAAASEHLFSRFSDLAPAAIYIFAPEKGMQYCNQKFFELTGHPHVNDNSEVDWDKAICAEDLHLLTESWKVLTAGEKPVAQSQFRLKRTWSNGEGVQGPVWAQALSSCVMDTTGHIETILGTLTDISQIKWAEHIQEKRIEDQRVVMEEAIESRRQQENFIDVTSHEMRNPLSAVIQCADSVIDCLQHVSNVTSNHEQTDLAEKVQGLNSEVQGALESIETIVSCSMHQKRIVDDILTLSKLDLKLIAITPIAVQPVSFVKDAKRLFEVECKKDGIKLELHEDASLAKCGAQNVLLDPVRLLQVLINFMANSIKFTDRDCPVRKITVSIGAMAKRPPNGWHGISFTSPKVILENIDRNSNERQTFLWIKVEDTGCGLTEDQQGRLFTRFTQATPRTHINYGGSGLGLFISKSLAELMHGAVGVKSKAGIGSTFAIYINVQTITPATTSAGYLLSRDYEQNHSSDSSDQIGPVISTVEESIHQSRYSVLIVEDNLVNQRVLSKQLSKAGCQVHVADHGEDALKFLRKTKHWRGSQSGLELSVILMDIEMPVMDGLTCTRRIRELEETGQLQSHIPILAVSANARSEQVAKAVAVGMDDAIAKPFRISELLPKIEWLARKASSASHISKVSSSPQTPL